MSRKINIIQKYTKKYISKYIKKYTKKYIKKYTIQNYFRYSKGNKLKQITLFINNYINNFYNCSLDDMNIGDIVCSVTMTNSQKYMIKYGYEEYNMTKYGILIKKNFDKSVILQYNPENNKYEKKYFYCDPLSSGYYILKKYIESS